MNVYVALVILVAAALALVCPYVVLLVRGYKPKVLKGYRHLITWPLRGCVGGIVLLVLVSTGSEVDATGWLKVLR